MACSVPDREGRNTPVLAAKFKSLATADGYR